MYWVTTCAGVFNGYLLFKIVSETLLFFAEMQALFLAVDSEFWFFWLWPFPPKIWLVHTHKKGKHWTNNLNLLWKGIFPNLTFNLIIYMEKILKQRNIIYLGYNTKYKHKNKKNKIRSPRSRWACWKRSLLCQRSYPEFWSQKLPCEHNSLMNQLTQHKPINIYL